MQKYVATFHTHISALRSKAALDKAGLPARMAPVPRVLSASCGTCVFYEANEASTQHMDEDVEAIFQQQEDEKFKLVYSAED